jgi:hypothetical protein
MIFRAKGLFCEKVLNYFFIVWNLKRKGLFVVLRKVSGRQTSTGTGFETEVEKLLEILHGFTRIEKMFYPW